MTVGATMKTPDGLTVMLARQRAALLRDGPPPLAQRRSDLMKLKNALREHLEGFVAAINTDFGHRSRQETSLFDLVSVVEGINFLHRNLRRWMQPERRRVGLSFLPRLQPRPLSAARRRRHHLALELSRCAGADAACDGLSSWRSRHDQAVRVDTADISVNKIGPGQGLC